MARSSSASAEFTTSASIFAALGNATRLQLAARLSNSGPMSITELAAGFPMTRQAITKHLRMMEHAGLVRSAPHGRESVWQLEERRLADARRHLQAISAQWDEKLGRLKRFVERREVLTCIFHWCWCRRSLFRWHSRFT